MTPHNRPILEQYERGIEERNQVIDRQCAEIEALTTALREIVEALEGYYDGAPDSPTRWLSAPLTLAKDTLEEKK